MTNQKQEILEIWTNLKLKLEKLTLIKSLIKNNQALKALFKEILTTHLNQSVSFLAEYISLPCYRGSEEIKAMKRDYQYQKEKNEKIVRECQELLEELE